MVNYLNKATVFLTARITDEGVVCAIPFSLPIIAYQLEKIKRLIKKNEGTRIKYMTGKK